MQGYTDNLEPAVAGMTIALERMVTLVLWEYESNPVVLELGRIPWVLLSVLLIGSIWLAWEYANAKESLVAPYVLWVIAGFHLLAVGSNLAFVYWI